MVMRHVQSCHRATNVIIGAHSKILPDFRTERILTNVAPRNSSLWYVGMDHQVVPPRVDGWVDISSSRIRLLE